MKKVFIIISLIILLIILSILWNIPYENKYSHLPHQFTIKDPFIYGTPINLLELDKDEEDIYNKFSEKYDDNILRGVDPLAICKMYLFAHKIKDYETAYELYFIENPDVRPSKEDYLAMTNEESLTDLDLFCRVEDVGVKKTKEEAIVNWKYSDKLGSISFNNKEKKGRYSFNKEKSFYLRTKGQGLWKVRFMPMQ